MRTSTQKRIAQFSGLLLLALLVVALAVPAAQAMRDSSTGMGGSSASAGSGTSTAQQLPTLAQVSGRVAAVPGRPSQGAARRPPSPAYLQRPSGSPLSRWPESCSSVVGHWRIAAGGARKLGPASFPSWAAEA